MSGPGDRPAKFKWRKWNNILHRDLGYLAVGLTVVYAVSGVAVNHIHEWNPSFQIERVTESIEPIAVSDRETMVAEAVERLELGSLPKASFRPDPVTLQLFYDDWSVEVKALEGVATIERPRDRFLLRSFNFLHLNHAKKLWTWVADLYALVLLLLATTGLFVLKGRKGLSGRGKWLVAAGVLLPVLFLVLYQ